eukprot:1971707-Pleurochrysis_carterae.AAC.2
MQNASEPRGARLHKPYGVYQNLATYLHVTPDGHVDCRNPIAATYSGAAFRSGACALKTPAGGKCLLPPFAFRLICEEAHARFESRLPARQPVRFAFLSGTLSRRQSLRTSVDV